ncbi:unnamed protein product [Haemonchus placei]|uniref:BAR domain-containing protein n=1 Tax=Haemonchus placei TaxID=6290 RepID=A0A0N4W5J9_HAEPC|nr:unnamed protein product [Haemonchus placei]
MIHEQKNVRPHPDQNIHEVMLENTLWEYRSCDIYRKKMRELSELKAGSSSSLHGEDVLSTLQQKISGEIDDHMHALLDLVTPVCDNSRNFSNKLSEDVEEIRERSAKC